MPISDQPGNPAHAIRAQYQELMTIPDLPTLRQRALSLLQQGISARNAARFRATVQREQRLDRLQQFLTNFLLKADGHGVL